MIFTKKKDILVIDLAHLPAEVQDESLDDLRLKYEKELDAKIIFIDASRINAYTVNGQVRPPIYKL